MSILVTSMGLEWGHELCLAMGHTAKIVSTGLEDVPCGWNLVPCIVLKRLLRDGDSVWNEFRCLEKDSPMHVKGQTDSEGESWLSLLFLREVSLHRQYPQKDPCPAG